MLFLVSSSYFFLCLPHIWNSGFWVMMEVGKKVKEKRERERGGGKEVCVCMCVCVCEI